MGVNGIYGLSGSGLDIESLVKMGMSAKNKQYDKLESQEIANTWLKEAYNDIYMDMTTYKYGTLSTYKMQSNMNAMQASSSNSGVVTATANGAAAAMNHTVTVESVASNAYLLTTQDSSGKNLGVTRNNTEAQTSNKLVDVIFNSYEVKTDDDDGTGNYIVNGNAVKGSEIAISLKLKDTTGDKAEEYTLTYTYDELFKGKKTLNDFASAIARTGANIQGGYDTANDSFSIYNKTSGKDNVIDITVGNQNTVTLFNNLNLGKVDALDGSIGTKITFEEPEVMPTTVASVDLTSIEGTAQSTSLKDILGLKATVNGDNTTVTQVNSRGEVQSTVGTFSNGSDTVFSMNLSNGTDSATISFTLDELFTNSFGLDELAAKINAAKYTDGEGTEHSLGITAKYDAIADSFSLSNPTGQANLAAVAGTGESTATQLIDSLNLTTSPSLKLKTTTDSRNLADILGISSTAQVTKTNGKFCLTLNAKQDGTPLASIGPVALSDYFDSVDTYKNQTLLSFDISVGSNTATVELTYDDLINFGAITPNDNYSCKLNGNILNKDAGAQSVPVAPNSLEVLANKINTVAKDLNVSATFDNASGTFTILSKNGSVSISDKDPGAKVASKLNLVDGDPSDVAYKVSSGITRVNTTSTDDSLASILGLTAVNNNDGTLTVKKADSTNSETVATTDVAISLKVGNGTSEETVELTYADLFDTTKSGTLKGTADFSTLVTKINGEDAEHPGPGASVGVTASYADGKLSLHNDAGDAVLTGGDALGSALVSKMNITETEASKKYKEEQGQLHTWAGTNASVKIDGKTYDNDTNKLTVAGVTYTFLDSTKDVVGQKITVSVSQDTDKIVDYVKSFVEDYNKLLDSLNEKLSEKKYSDYKPLSKRQEDEMTEKQIEKWNEKAKSGLLYHNSDIQALVSAMREAIYTKVDAVDSEYNTLSSIGITTTNTKGHLTLDTDKLKKALAADPDCVYQLFASDQDSSYISGSTNKNKITDSQKRLDYANTGIANRLDSVMTTHMKKISDIAGTSKDTDDQSYLGKLITQMQAKMSSFKTLMTSYENKLYKRYDAMEVALSKLNMQLGYISGSFS